MFAKDIDGFENVVFGLIDCLRNAGYGVNDTVHDYFDNEYFKGAKNTEDRLRGYATEADKLSRALYNLYGYEVLDVDIVSGKDKELLEIINSDGSPDEGERITKIQKRKNTDAWVYRVPRDAILFVRKDITTGEMVIALNGYGWHGWYRPGFPMYKYQIIA